MELDSLLDFLDGPGMFILIALAFGVVFIVSTVIMNKKKKEIMSLIQNAKAMTESNDKNGALSNYKSVLNHLWGINGQTELTIEGITSMMDDYGWNMLEDMKALYSDPANSFDVNEIKEVMNDLKAMKENKKLVDRDGLPKGEGKKIFKNMLSKLTEIHSSIPAVS